MNELWWRSVVKALATICINWRLRQGEALLDQFNS